MVEIKGVVMEEKERYKVSVGSDYITICDYEENRIKALDNYGVQSLLNLQDKHIKELQQKLTELEDVLEEFELTSAEDLRNYLNFKTNMAIWEGELNYKNKIADLEQELAELKQKAIVPKFRTYQPIFYITQYYTSTKGNPEYDIISDKYYVAENENEIILGWNYAKDFNQRKYYYIRKDWVFATKEEAEAKLKELGEKK